MSTHLFTHEGSQSPTWGSGSRDIGLDVYLRLEHRNPRFESEHKPPLAPTKLDVTKWIHELAAMMVFF